MIISSSGNSFNVAKIFVKGEYNEEVSHFFYVYSDPPIWTRG
jgi:hypothetical protein